jgi:catalase
MELTPSVLFDALVLPDGEDAISTLSATGQAKEFVVNQYRHSKTILAFGASKALLDKAGIPMTLPDGADDPGLLLADANEDVANDFMAALAMHRHPERETDPPRV